MAKVWITEKPTAAKDLAEGLTLAYGIKYVREKSGLFVMSDGDIILPLVGHVISTVRPGFYLSEEHAAIENSRDFANYHRFLPILPDSLAKIPRVDIDAKGKTTNKPFAPYVLAAKTLKSAKEIVNAGDIDREGQLIVDELLTHLGIDPCGTKPMVWRFGIASNIASDIAAALKLPREKNSDKKWQLLSLAAQSRQYLDYVWGMNMSMIGQVQYNSPRIAIGRVQTPVAEIVNQRNLSIKKFKPVRYFVPVVILKDGSKLRWFKREGAEGAEGFDEQGRIINEDLARQIVARITGGMPGRVSLAKVTEHKEKPPLPFSMGTLASTASRRMGATLKEISTWATSLRAGKTISYIGTDCKFLPTAKHSEAKDVLRTLSSLFPKQAPGADTNIMSAAFNDSKLDEHFAIIPTGILPVNASTEELALYRIIASRYIAQFYPDAIFRRHKIEATFGGDYFQVSTRQDVRLGWREVEGQGEDDAKDTDGETIRDKDQPEDDVKEVQK